jgi:hypothetical protein
MRGASRGPPRDDQPAAPTLESAVQTRLLALCVLLAAALVGPSSPVASAEETLDLALGEKVAVDAAVTVTETTVESGTLILSGSVDDTATVLGRTATIETQPVTVTADTSCKGGSGTLVLTTTELSASLSDGTTLTVDPAKVTVQASCGKEPSLKVTADALTVSLSDGTTVQTSSCTVEVSSPAFTEIGSTLCEIKELICELDDLVSGQRLTEAVDQLQQVLDTVESTLG